ncbi:polyphosphate kinase 1 [Granulicella paludicola]|uniref:polyphosphate kinase 1 n=1 Tax=Granulicella paludicola TaxID=474951 RepID=UPI0021E0E536|nr:polyphosphate kinase 1 [Granulicella paludicola]
MTTKKTTPKTSKAIAAKPAAISTRSVAARGKSAKNLPGGRFINRDESWMQFNRRVLQEAEDATNPLLERVKFLAITASNLDEFIEIRVAGILQKMEENLGLPQSPDEGGLTQDERLEKLQGLLHGFSKEQDECWNKKVSPALSAAGIKIVQWKQLREADRTFAARYFHEEIDPLLTPVTLDPAHPFPRVLNKALCLALLLRHKRRTKAGSKGGSNPKVIGVVTIPRALPTLIALPERDGRHGFLRLEDLIEAHLESMFRGYNILDRATFRVTRNSNLYMQEEESRSLLESVAGELHNRRKGDAVRMEIEDGASEEIVERLRSNFELDAWQVFPTTAPVSLSRLFSLYGAVKQETLKFPEFHGRRLKLEQSRNIFAELRKGDILLHHPYDSYNTVEEFIEAGASDPAVISIKQTLYRTSADSTIFSALREGAQSKDVTVVVELMARFDESSNIRWSRELEDAGVQVFHGIYGYKTHCKLALIVRRDSDGVVRSYAHLGTGNYNPVTSRFYTDISLLTARTELTEAVLKVFRYLTAEWEAGSEAYRPLLVAPVTLAKDMLRLIARETEHARKGQKARIIAKVNGLLDEPTIEALYTASQAGVDIDLIVRGMCALRPGVKGLSERIRVRSVVGRFLEHSRIFWFANGGMEEVYCGSADWMSRNLYERCEVVFPVTDEAAKRRLRDEILEAYLRDDVKARLLEPDGSHVRAPQGVPSSGKKKPNRLSAQDWFMRISSDPEMRLGAQLPVATTLKGSVKADAEAMVTGAE